MKPTLVLLLVTTRLVGGLHTSVENGVALEMSTCSPGDGEAAGYWQVSLHVPAVGYQLVGEIDAADTSHRWLLPDSTKSLFLESRDNPELVFRILGEGVFCVSRICLKLEHAPSVWSPGRAISTASDRPFSMPLLVFTPGQSLFYARGKQFDS